MKLFFYWLGGWFTWYAVGAAVIGAAGNYLGRAKPAKAVEQKPLALGELQGQAITDNLANESSIEQLISRGNAFTTNQALNIQNTVMPGYSDLAKSLSSRAKTLADHPYDVPQEVQDNIARIAAERGISAGTRGQFNDFSLLRDFGISELQYGQTAINQAQSLTGTLAAIAPKVNPMSPLSFYVTPSEAVATTASNNANAQAIRQAQENAIAASKNAGNADLFGSLGKIAGMFGGAMGGSGGGGDGGALDAATLGSVNG